MSIKSRASNPQKPSPESGRPRLRGKITKLAPLNLTDFQRQLHAMSTKQVARSKTKGAFGGVTKDERALRSIRRRLAK